jgi:NAD(P)-dependent dehydrogenase (short-subunit alcohol dehydrogenase family)
LPVQIDLSGSSVPVAGSSSSVGLGIAQELRGAGAEVHMIGANLGLADYQDRWDREGLNRLPLVAANDRAFKGLLRADIVEITHARRSRDSAHVYRGSLKCSQIRRWGGPDGLGGAAAFLVPRMSTHAAGRMLLVDGGHPLI